MTGLSLYGALTPWYRLLDPPEDHRDEAASYARALLEGMRAAPARPTLLELGAGAGHNALHLKERFECTLSDLSPDMLALSRELNPSCVHVEGDMRTLRLGRTFDAVLVHDAIAYMTTEADLAAVAETAYVHTRPGGAALFAPDDYAEGFAEGTELIETSDGARALKCIEWSWDPDPSDTTCRAEYVYVMREGERVHTAHETHVLGLFPSATWVRILEDAGWSVDTVERWDEGKPLDRVFRGVRA